MLNEPTLCENSALAHFVLKPSLCCCCFLPIFVTGIFSLWATCPRSNSRQTILMLSINRIFPTGVCGDKNSIFFIFFCVCVCLFLFFLFKGGEYWIYSHQVGTNIPPDKCLHYLMFPGSLYRRNVITCSRFQTKAQRRWKRLSGEFTEK